MAASNTYEQSTVLKDVRIILDMNEDSTKLTFDGITDADQLQTDDIIKKVMTLALERVYQVAPIELLVDDSAGCKVEQLMLSPIGHKGYGKWAAAPAGLTRIVSLYAEDWSQPVFGCLSPSDDLYAQQKSNIAGVRGSVDDPVAFLMPNPTDAGLRIEVYTTGDDSIYIRYVGAVSAGAEGSVSMPSQCYGAYLYFVASLYYVTLGSKEMADMMAAEAAEALRLTTNKTE